MAFSEEFSLITVVFGSLLYCTVFILSVVGNSWIIVVTYQRTIKKRIFNHFTCLVANLAFADLVFISLTIFNFVSFYSDWPGGDTTCKFHGFLVEATYTTSISTLIVISYQRLRAVTDPFKARFCRWIRMKYTKLAIIWGLCFAVCSPLIFIYRVETRNGQIICVTTTWGDTGRQIYYSLHGTLFFCCTFIIHECHTDKHKSRSSAKSQSSTQQRRRRN